MHQQGRKNIICHSDGAADQFANLLQYLQTGERRLVVQKAFKTFWVDQRVDPDGRRDDTGGAANKRLVEVHGSQRQIGSGSDGRGESSSSSINTPTTARAADTLGIRQNVSFSKATPAKIESIINRISAYPLHNARYTRHWHESQTCKYLLPEDKVFRHAKVCN